MHPEVYVCVDSVMNTDLGLCVGLRQGCCFLSPIRFHIYMDGIVKKSESCGEVKTAIALYDLCYLHMILRHSSLPKIVSEKLLSDFWMHALLPE